MSAFNAPFVLEKGWGYFNFVGSVQGNGQRRVLLNVEIVIVQEKILE